MEKDNAKDKDNTIVFEESKDSLLCVAQRRRLADDLLGALRILRRAEAKYPQDTDVAECIEQILVEDMGLIDSAEEELFDRLAAAEKPSWQLVYLLGGLYFYLGETRRLESLLAATGFPWERIEETEQEPRLRIESGAGRDKQDDIQMREIERLLMRTCSKNEIAETLQSLKKDPDRYIDGLRVLAYRALLKYQLPAVKLLTDEMLTVNAQSPYSAAFCTAIATLEGDSEKAETYRKTVLARITEEDCDVPFIDAVMRMTPGQGTILYFEERCDLDPFDTGALVTLAELYGNEGYLEDAQSCVLDALTLHPKDAVALQVQQELAQCKTKTHFILMPWVGSQSNFRWQDDVDAWLENVAQMDPVKAAKTAFSRKNFSASINWLFQGQDWNRQAQAAEILAVMPQGRQFLRQQLLKDVPRSVKIDNLCLLLHYENKRTYLVREEDEFDAFRLSILPQGPLTDAYYRAVAVLYMQNRQVDEFALASSYERLSGLYLDARKSVPPEVFEKYGSMRTLAGILLYLTKPDTLRSQTACADAVFTGDKEFRKYYSFFITGNHEQKKEI